MERSIFHSEAADAKDSFAETFGRGCLIKYKQPSYSERNNFQLSKMHAQQASRNQLKRPLFPSPDLLKTKKQQNQGGKKANRCSDFEKIDEINNKICGLIKSISASCHKQLPITDKNDRDLPKKAQQASYTASKDKNLDLVKTQKKKRQELENDYIKAKLIDYEQEKKHEKYISHHTYSQKFIDNSTNRSQNQTSIDLNERIKKINDKISNYQNRIKANTKEAIIDSKHHSWKHRPLGQFKDFTNIKEKPYKKQSISKFRYILNERENSGAKPKQSTNIAQAKKTGQLFRRTALFNEKQNQIVVKNVRQQEQSSFDKLKLSKIQVEKRYKFQSKKVVNQQKSTINTINDQLLSYKPQFLKQMVKQIALDHDFRHAKHMFGGIQGLFDESDPSQKWNNLQKQLKNEGFNLSLSEVKEIFMPRDDEIDPFLSVSHSHQQLIHGLIFAYRTCQRNWNENMYHSWSLWELRESKFTAQNLDQSKRGSIALEDLTFYLNTELDGNYRNRDLMLIFNRFKNTKHKPKFATQKTDDNYVKFKDIMDKLLSI